MKHQAGVTLVEVLVSMVIMALGLVSLAALQNFTLRYQLGSVHRAQLSGLLSDYAERVRSNLGQAPGIALSTSDPDASYLFIKDWGAQKAEPVVTTSCAGGSTCSDIELVKADMQEWRSRVRRELPRGSVWVTGDAIQGLTVTFMWSDKEFVASAGGAASTPHECATSDTGLAEQTCCPKDANAPKGVRCATFSIIP